MLTVDVAIVGAGFAGLYAAKHCLRDEVGLSVVVLERSAHWGGVWHPAHLPPAYPTFSVTSKLYLSPTDFPPPDDWPEFPSAEQVFAHLDAYAHHFGLGAHVLTNQTVVTATDAPGRGWTLTTAQGLTVRARRLVVATGVNHCPYVPTDPMYARFTGVRMHAERYDRSLCVGKRVLIVGGSDAASDLAGDVCRVAAKTYLSIRDGGQWFQDRMLGAESPADMFYSRFVNWLTKNVVGKAFIHHYLGTDLIDTFWGAGGSDVPEWQPRCKYLNSIYNKSRDIVRLVGFGLVTPCGAVTDIQGARVRCGTKEFDVDVIWFATGYRYLRCSQTFLDPGLRAAPRWKQLFPVDREDVAFVGFVRPYLTSIPSGPSLPAVRGKSFLESDARRRCLSRCNPASWRGSSPGADTPCRRAPSVAGSLRRTEPRPRPCTPRVGVGRRRRAPDAAIARVPLPRRTHPVRRRPVRASVAENRNSGTGWVSTDRPSPVRR